VHKDAAWALKVSFIFVSFVAFVTTMMMMVPSMLDFQLLSRFD